MIITVDGPAGSGKSTISKLLAERLNIIYLDTGAMYRAVAYLSLKHNWSDEDIVREANFIDLHFYNKGANLIVEYGGEKEDISKQIRSPEVSIQVPIISRIQPLRDILKNKQREFPGRESIIVDGRDMGVVVFPNAEFKFFLIADSQERAKRRFLEWQEKDIDVNYETVLKQMIERDKIDSKNTLQAEDAIVVDTSHMSIEDVVMFIADRVRAV